MTNPNGLQSLLPATQPIAVSPTEAARLIGIGRTTLYEALSSGALRSAKIGKRRLITIEAIKDWLDACEVSDRASTTGAADQR